MTAATILAILGLSCSVSSVESEQSEVEGDLETVEAHQFEPVVASDSSAESDYRRKMGGGNQRC